MLTLKKIEYKYLVAIIYTCVLFLDRLDLTMVNIALPTLAHYFKVPITATEWISNGFLLALAISIPASAWLGDRLGIKKIFIFSTTLFSLSAFLCALSHSFILLIVLRFLQGIGGGLLIPVGMTMLYRVFEPKDYARITSYTFFPALLAPAFAPAIGGTILHFLNWQWIFIISASVCSVAVIMSFLVLKEQEMIKTKWFDWLGFLFASCILILGLYTLSDFGKNGLSHFTIYSFLIVIVLIYGFMKQEKHCQHPLIHLQLFDNKMFVQSNLIQLVFQICHYASFYIIGIYLQVGVGMSAFIAGIIIGMQAIGAMFTNRLSVKLFYAYGPGITLIAGFIGLLIFSIGILFIKTPADYLLGCLILFSRGLFSGICGIPLQLISLLGFENQQISQASAVSNAVRQVAITLGIALASFMISYGIKTQHAILINGLLTLSVFYGAFILIFISALIGIGLSYFIDNKKALALTGK